LCLTFYSLGNFVFEGAKTYWTQEDQEEIFELGLNMLLTNMLHKIYIER